MEKQKRSLQKKFTYQKNIITFKDKLLLSKNKKIAELSRFKIRVEEVNEKTYQDRQKYKQELQKERSMHSLLIKEEKQASKKQVKKLVANAKKALEEKDLDCAIKLKENNDNNNNNKIKNI